MHDEFFELIIDITNQFLAILPKDDTKEVKREKNYNPKDKIYKEKIVLRNSEGKFLKITISYQHDINTWPEGWPITLVDADMEITDD
jgi:hypothetical protein